MRHISPKEMVSMLPEIPLSRVIFRRPASGVGTLVEMLAKNGEEIMISEPGTPDPVVFTSPDAMAFFHELGLLSGEHDGLVLDGRHFRPAGFGFLQGNPEQTFGQVRQRGEAAEALDFADAASESTAELEKSQFTTTIYTLNDAFGGNESTTDEVVGDAGDMPEDGELEEEEEKHYIGEKYLTTRNLINLTVGVVTFSLVLVFTLSPAVGAMKDVLYICVGSMVVLALSFIFFEKRNPEHPSLRVRRYIWLCLLVFNVSMVLSYMMMAGKAAT